MNRKTLIGCSALLLAGPVTGAETAEPAAQKAVLVTGASVGIGRKITERLAAEGWFVYAGARKDTDLRELDAIANVDSVRLDVTRPEEIAAAVETIRKAGRGLHGVVNNAGVAIIDPVTSTRDEDFDFLMQVNVYGVLRVTRAFAPLVAASRGRFVNISSISAFLPFQGAAAYNMSKAAVEAFTDVLAIEMAPLGVQVSAVEPGAYNTDILKPALARSVTKGFNADRATLKPPDEVAAVVLEALSDPKPRRRYMVVPNQGQAEVTIRAVMDQLAQLNESPQYAYDRATLIRMLEEAMARARAR